MKFLLSLLLLPSLALAASVTGTVTLLDGTPLGGAVVKVGADSVVSLANGSFTLGRSTSIASRSGKTIPVTSHLAIENGRPRLSFGGFDIAGRARPANGFARMPVEGHQSIGGRSAATGDTLKLTWNGKRIFALPVPSDTTVAFKIDTAWKDDAGIPWNPRIGYGSLFDARDGQTYRTVVIGSQMWMAENLNFKMDSSWWFLNSPNNGLKYGRIYNWATAMGLGDSCNRRSCSSQVTTRHKGSCPEGWHVPVNAEWTKLHDTTLPGGHSGLLLKSSTGWNNNDHGNDSTGFRALPGGWRSEYGVFFNRNISAYFWTASRHGGLNAYNRYLYN
ncbi:MAG: hypothetical protein RL318_2763, partial [Fibrobacterota bacterium]